MMRFTRWRLGWLAVAVLAGSAYAQPPAPAAPPAPQPNTSSPESVESGHVSVSFHAPRTVLRLGSTRVIPFEVPSATDDDRTLPALAATPTDDAPGRVEIIRPAQVIAGHTTGFVRVRPTREGVTTLTVGDATLSIHVAPESPATAANRRPVIHTPSAGAMAWGKIAVGVDLFVDSAGTADQGPKVQLVLPDGKRLDPITQTDPKAGPTRQLGFELDLATHKPGSMRLIAEAVDTAGQVTQSRAVWVQVVDTAAAGASLILEEAEAHKDAKRPERFGDRPLALGDDAKASGGKFVVNNSADPMLTIPMSLETGGWYQVAAVFAGDTGGGVLPTVGLRLNEDNQPRTAVRLADRAWRRYLVGQPIYINDGEQFIHLRFENDFNAGRAGDRNLRIDRYELLRVDQLPRMDHAVEDTIDGGQLTVAIDPALAGAVVGGAFDVRGRVHVASPGDGDAPAVTLVVNGNAIATQYTREPLFRVWPSALQPGDNTLHLRVVTGRGLCGDSVTIPITRIAPDVPRVADVGNRQFRFYVADPAWSGLGQLGEDRAAGDNRVRHFNSNGHGELRLPEDLAGAFDVMVDARGDVFEGEPVAQVTLLHADNASAVGDVKVGTSYGMRRAGEVSLDRGAKSLRVGFINDHYKKGAGDRNLVLRGVMLAEKSAIADTAAPVVSLAYPAPEQAMFGVDAVVAVVGDDRQLDWVELLIDGKPTGQRVGLRESGRGRVVLPVLWRGYEPGTRQLSVVAVDRAGNRATSEAVAVRLLASAPESLTRYELALRTLDRFGFGMETPALAQALVMGHRAYLAQQFGGEAPDAGDRAAWAWVNAAFPNDADGSHVIRRAIGHAARTDNPARARFTLLMDNHFTTWQQKARPERKGPEYRGLAALGLAPFSDMLFHSATSPAMLFYLDQNRSFGRRLNENYAREIMELHTVGVHAGYTQQDVTELANLLTGWRFARTARLDGGGGYLGGAFRFDPLLSDPAPRSLFGLRFESVPAPELRYDRARTVIDMLASHPQTARFVARKIAEHYTTTPADAELIEMLARVFHETGGDTGAVMLALADWPGLWVRDAQPRLTHPLSHGLRLTRATGRVAEYRIDTYLRRAGFGLFDRDTPDGYPEVDAAYANTNTMLQRWRLAHEMRNDLAALVPGHLHQQPKEPALHPAWRQQVVDLVAVGLTGQVLGEQSNRAVLEVFAQLPATGVEEVRTIATLVAQMPEASMR